MAGGNFIALCFQYRAASAGRTAASRIDDPQTVGLLMAVGNMGVSVESSGSAITSGILYKRCESHFYVVPVTVGHVKPNASHIIAQHLGLISGAAIKVAVAGHLMDDKMGILLSDDTAIVKIISQMDNGIRLHRTDAPAHKGNPGMGIGQYKYLHGSPTSMPQHIVVQNMPLL